MATLTELVDLDSGVASSEATPEGQTVIVSSAEEVAQMSLAGEEILEVAKETVEEEKKESDEGIPPVGGATTNSTSSAVVAATKVTAEDDNEDDESKEFPGKADTKAPPREEDDIATLTELVDLDSGFAFIEATPEGQTVIVSSAEEVAQMSLAGEEILEVAKETVEEEEKKESDEGIPPVGGGTTNSTSSAVVAATKVTEEDDEESKEFPGKADTKAPPREEEDMATLTELVDLDSGVASSEATPEGQTVIVSSAEEVAQMSLAGEEILEVAKETVEEEEKKESDEGIPPVVATTNSTSSAVVAATKVTEEDDDEEDMDESLGERVAALTEMFPDCLRSASVNAVSTSVGLLKNSYSVTRQIVWVVVSTSILLFAPVMFELERLNVEEMMKQDRNRLVLGPGSAVSGASPTSGLMPPPPTR